MCGLAGVILNQNKSRNGDAYETIGEVFKGVLVNAQSRGRHASGFSIVFDSKEYILYKRPVDAGELVRQSDADAQLGLVDDSTTAIIGHTRYATQGDVNTNSNNHPIRAGSVIGTHNGWVSNDDQLFSKFDLERHAEVDSEVIFRMFDEANDEDEFFDKMLPNAKGKISAVWADVELPNIVYVLKGNNPLALVYVKELGALFYASNEWMITSVLSNFNLDYKVVKIESGTAVRFDTERWTTKTRKISFRGMIKRVVKTSYKQFKFNSRPTKVEAPVVGSCKMPNRKLKGESTNTVKGFVPRYSYKHSLKIQTTEDLKRWNELDEAVAKARKEN